MNDELSKNRDLGYLAEEYAARFLKKHGYRIVERNLREAYKEVDIVALKKGRIAFVEVKAGKIGSLESPENRVNLVKMKNVVTAAERYVKKLRAAGIITELFDIGFDVAAVEYGKDLDVCKFKYYQDYYKVNEDEIF